MSQKLRTKKTHLYEAPHHSRRGRITRICTGEGRRRGRKAWAVLSMSPSLQMGHDGRGILLGRNEMCPAKKTKGKVGGQIALASRVLAASGLSARMRGGRATASHTRKSPHHPPLAPCDLGDSRTKWTYIKTSCFLLCGRSFFFRLHRPVTHAPQLNPRRRRSTCGARMRGASCRCTCSRTSATF